MVPQKNHAPLRGRLCLRIGQASNWSPPLRPSRSVSHRSTVGRIASGQYLCGAILHQRATHCAIYATQPPRRPLATRVSSTTASAAWIQLPEIGAVLPVNLPVAILSDYPGPAHAASSGGCRTSATAARETAPLVQLGLMARVAPTTREAGRGGPQKLVH